MVVLLFAELYRVIVHAYDGSRWAGVPQAHPIDGVHVEALFSVDEAVVPQVQPAASVGKELVPEI